MNFRATAKNNDIAHRIQVAASGDVPQKCSIPGCGRLTMRAQGVGLAAFHCRYHVQLRARHGSHWHRSYSAADLKPYLWAAGEWIKSGGDQNPSAAEAIRELDALLSCAGPVEIATRLKGMPADKRARVAFARLRDANISPERLLVIYLAVRALIEDDLGSHRVREFILVQTAKAVHRLASGYHRRWEVQLHNGLVAPIAMHAYPKPSGRVLRLIGEAIDKPCCCVALEVLSAILALKTARFGPHPSKLPGWTPVWKRELEAARTKERDPFKRVV